jgi:D-glycero-D-manno-heptose 1,7-bisphosphate phosphatase
MFKLIALDRDGVINEDSSSYIKSPSEWQAIPGSLEAIAKLKSYGFKVAVATNQSGVARGYFTQETLDSIHEKMTTQLAAAGGSIDAIFVCPHGPQDNCDCRKPKPGLLLQAARQFNVDPKEILFIGDSMRDILAAEACGAKAILVKTGKGEETQKAGTDVPVYADLAEAVDLFVIKN